MALLPALLLLALTPGIAAANGAVPILNFFNWYTWQPAVIAMIFIIGTESFLLRRKIPNISFNNVLWRNAIMNFASSVAGSILLIPLASPNMYLEFGKFMIILFIATLIVEIPLLFALFQPFGITLKQAFSLGIRINFVSYLVLFMLQFIALFILFKAYGGRM